MKSRFLRRMMVGCLVIGITGTTTTSHAKFLVKNTCRVKGQEENTLQGLGLVLGLKGTGDNGSSLPMIRIVMAALRLMGNPVDKELDLKDTKNVALVMVTATVPANGARQGDKLDCTVSSMGSAKSLDGGYLFMTPLQGPQLQNPAFMPWRPGNCTLTTRKFPRSRKSIRVAGWKRTSSTSLPRTES